MGEEDLVREELGIVRAVLGDVVDEGLLPGMTRIRGEFADRGSDVTKR